MVDILLKTDASASITKTSDGTEGPAKADLYGGLLFEELLPRYFAMSQRGILFSAATAVAGVDHGTAVDTTAAFTLYNPAGSGKRLVALRGTMSYISGTLGAGTVWAVANVNNAATAVSGTAITVMKGLLGTASTTAQGNTGLAFTTATLPATPQLLRPCFSLAPLLATTAVAPYFDETIFDGEYVVEPGCALSFEATATAGTTPRVAFGMTWAEVPA